MKKSTLLIPLMALSLFACVSGTSQSSKDSSTSENPNTSETQTSSKDNSALKETTLYLVGDSTVSSFNDAYYYPRYGYGTQMGNYLDAKVTVNNLALSGRSSKSFITEGNYNTLTNGIKEGDYLMIGFGHNDEKSADASVFTNPTGSKEDETSFKHYLYEYYIKLAQDKGATPILCTPIVRADTSNNYGGNSGHITSDGDYAQCIRDLGTELGVTVIDLTKATKDLYTEIGFNEAIYYHAWTNSKSSSVDKTHLNIYGAKNTAYMVASELKNSTNSLKDYVLDDIKAPTKDADLVVNPDYIERPYTSFDSSTYVPNPRFANFTSEGWYGTAFGDTGGSPVSNSNGFVAEETSTGVFRVGQTGTSSAKGKISSSTDGIAMVFKQVDKSKNFAIEVDMKVLTTDVNATDQAGFGLMVRDDIYVNLESADSSINSNYLAAGLLADKVNTDALFKRESTKLNKGSNSISGLYAVDDTAHAKIVRTGQYVDYEITYKGKTYSERTSDFDLVAIDTEYMYVGMFANRGTTIECTNVSFEITGEAQVA